MEITRNCLGHEKVMEFQFFFGDEVDDGGDDDDDSENGFYPAADN